MVTTGQEDGQYLLSIEDIPSAAGPRFPAYFVGSTAPNNVEDGVDKVANPQLKIDKIADFLVSADEPELLIAVHGYNTALGQFAEGDELGDGVKGWYQEIRDHIDTKCDRRSSGFMFLGYRWPSEEINGGGKDSLGHKLTYARKSLPITLKVILFTAFFLLLGLIPTAFIPFFSESRGWGALIAALLIVAIILLSLVLTLFLLRLVGYFRDAYRASNFGVPDLVELVRQLDKAVVIAAARVEKEPPKIKLSFIGHSMGGFVVTNTVRILSDVFDFRSIGSLNSSNNNDGDSKLPSAEIGNVFMLGQLVLVSPDIPAETIISGRANFLSSSLRRFEETYLFSNEGDMALKLASTVANYASFPARTREGGYRLGNVVVRSPHARQRKLSSLHYGIVNYDPTQSGGVLLDVQSKEKKEGVEPQKVLEKRADGKTVLVSAFLKYLYILRDKSLSSRQQEIIEPDQKPIAELFTVFDCTDYFELLQKDGKKPKKVGLLTKALGQPSLSFGNYVALTIAMVSGKIDTHGGYFYSGKGDKQETRPEAVLTKQLIYGLACLGFQSFVGSLSPDGTDAPTKDDLTKLSELCESRQIQVLLSAERFNRDILKLEPKASDRDGY